LDLLLLRRLLPCLLLLLLILHLGGDLFGCHFLPFPILPILLPSWGGLGVLAFALAAEFEYLGGEVNDIGGGEALCAFDVVDDFVPGADCFGLVGLITDGELLAALLVGNQ
jgi:hypothetical protein